MADDEQVERELVVQRNARRGGEPQAQMRRERKDGWTAERRGRFLAVLSDTCNVSEALRVVGMSDTSLYDLRKRDATFAEQWQEALDAAYDKLEWLLVQRACFGDERVETIHEGSGDTAKVKGTKTVRSLSSMMGWKLLTAHRGTVERYRAEKAAATMNDEAARARMRGVLADMEQKLIRIEGRQERRKQAALERRAARRGAEVGAA